MTYTRVIVQFSASDTAQYDKLSELILDTYPTGDWVVDLDNCDNDERKMEFIVDDANYARQVLTGFAGDFGRNVTSFIEKPSSQDEFDEVSNS
jgi:hypothetical protein